MSAFHAENGEVRYRTAMRDLIGERFGAVWKAVPRAIDESDVNGVHDVRVASRRLRAAMDVAVGCFPASWYAPLHETAKEITSALGEVRDREVILEFLAAEHAAAPAGEQVGIDRLVARVSAELESARIEMLAFLGRIEEQGVADDAVRRFGEAARAPWSSAKGSADR